MTGALVLLVILLGGGAYGAWWYNQQQYYVGVHDGYVAIFRGTNQSVAGISLSSLLTPSTLKVSQLGTNDQGTISQTISKGSVADAEALITQLQSGVDQCHAQWTALATWQAQSVKYQADLAAAAKSKSKTKPRSRRATIPARFPPCPTRQAAPRLRRSAFRRRHCPRRLAEPARPHARPRAHSPSVTPSASVKKSATPRATA